MRRHGLPADVVWGDHTEESGVRAARDLLDPRPVVRGTTGPAPPETDPDRG
jgi:hypothetical protein